MRNCLVMSDGSRGNAIRLALTAAWSNCFVINIQGRFRLPRESRVPGRVKRHAGLARESLHFLSRDTPDEPEHAVRIIRLGQEIPAGHKVTALLEKIRTVAAGVNDF